MGVSGSMPKAVATLPTTSGERSTTPSACPATCARDVALLRNCVDTLGTFIRSALPALRRTGTPPCPMTNRFATKYSI